MGTTGRTKQASLFGALAAVFAALVLSLALTSAVWATEPPADDAAGEEVIEAVELTAEGGELESGYYVLTEDTVLEEDLVIAEGAEVTIDLAGYVLTGTGEGSVITVYGDLTIVDSAAGEVVEVSAVAVEEAADEEADDESDEESAAVAIDAEAEGAACTVTYTVTADGVVTTYEYASGAVTGGFATYGGGVYVAETGSLTLAGGAIAQNEAVLGGGVYVDGGTLVVSGGAIAGNIATDGAGVYNAAGSVTIGNAVEEEEAEDAEEAVEAEAVEVEDEAEAEDETEVEPADGIIVGNVASGSGGGVFNYDGVVTLSEGVIALNSAELGGGVYNTAVIEAATEEAEEVEESDEAEEAEEDAAQPGTFTMTGGVIADNAATDGAGIYNAYGTVVLGAEAEETEEADDVAEVEEAVEAEEVADALITGNVAAGNGGGVYTDGTLVLYAGTISDNAAVVGGGVYAVQDEYVAYEIAIGGEADAEEAEAVEDEATIIPLYAEDYEDAVFVYGDDDAAADEPEDEAEVAAEPEDEDEADVVIEVASALVATGGTIANNTAESAADVYASADVEIVLEGVNAESLTSADGTELVFEGWYADGEDEAIEAIESGVEYALTAVYVEAAQEETPEEEAPAEEETPEEVVTPEEEEAPAEEETPAEDEVVEEEHDYVAVVTDPTCTEDGYTTYTCSVCGDSYVEEGEPATGHSYDEGVVTVEATCTEDGVLTYTCTVCGDSYEEAIAATGHDYVAVVTDPTCTEDGYTTYTCSVCGDSYVEEGEPATGHDYVAETTVEATCTEDGVLTYTCTVCGDSYEEAIAATGHDYVAVVTDPTCTEDGYTTYTCTVCGDSYVDDYVDATGHSYDEGVVTVEATCTEDGELTYTCTACGDTYTEAIAATGHDYEAVVTDPTCTEDGYTTYTCSVCGDTYTEEGEPATGHSYSTLWNWTMDYGSCTLNLTCDEGDSKIAVEAEVTVEETTVDAAEDVLADEDAEEVEAVVYTAKVTYEDVEYVNTQTTFVTGTVTETETIAQVSESTDLVADEADEAEEADDEAEGDEDVADDESDEDESDEDEDEGDEESGSSSGTVAVVILIILAIVVIAAIIVYFVGRSKKQ